LVEPASPYRPHGVVSIEEGATVFRWCLERPFDGQFAVVHTEFHDPFSDPEKLFVDTVTPVDKLNLTADDEADWKFFPTIQEAIATSKLGMTAYSEWMKNARNY
jgi:hypothetical protein